MKAITFDCKFSYKTLLENQSYWGKPNETTKLKTTSYIQRDYETYKNF